MKQNCLNTQAGLFPFFVPVPLGAGVQGAGTPSSQGSESPVSGKPVCFPLLPEEDCGSPILSVLV